MSTHTKQVIYKESDITFPTGGKNDKNEVLLGGKLVGYWYVGFECYFEPLSSENLIAFDARSQYSVQKQLLKQLNKTP